MRELTVQTDPFKKTSATIKRKVYILDNPGRVLDVLKFRNNITEGMSRNAITTGTN